jgi:uncharacterized damage-inducible protein DinB
MIGPAYVRTMAAYNAEMNRRQFAEAATLTEAQRQADRGVFWKSVQATLSHIYWGDLVWMWRLAGWPRPAGTVAESGAFVADFAELCARRAEADAGILAWAEGVDEPFLAREQVWFNRIAQAEMRHPNAFLAMHLFTHQVHHRGHVHAILTGYGVRTADTDLWAVVAPAA